MNPNRKADLCRAGSKTKFTGYELQAFSIAYSSEKRPLIQCQKCELLEARIRQFERLTLRLSNYIDEQRRPL